MRKQANALCRQGPFFSFPVVRVCDWGFIFAVLWREVTVLLNLKHLKYLRPPSLFHIREMAHSIHLDLSECIMVLRSCLLTAGQTGSHKHSGPSSHYVIYLSHSLYVKVRSSLRKSTTDSWKDYTNSIRQMASREIKYMFACGKRFMCQMNSPLKQADE